jgi:hypothetical protein
MSARKSMANGTTVKQIQPEVDPDITYVKFSRGFREKLGVQASPDQVTIRLGHKPAENTQNDFCTVFSSPTRPPAIKR